MVLLAVTGEVPGDNSPPLWNSTPAPVFTEGEAGTYSLLQDASDPDGDSLSFALVAGSLPTGVTISGTDLVADGTQVEGGTIGITLSVDDGTAAPVNSSSVTIQVLAAGQSPPPATIVVQANGGGDYTTIQAGVNAASAGDVIEVRANSEGGAANFIETVSITSKNGTNGNEIVLRGRAGDTINWYQTNAKDILVITDSSYLEIRDFNMGRDETDNGWTYTTGRQNVEHNYWLHLINSSYIRIEDIRAYGGKQYKSGYVEAGCHHIIFKYIYGSHAGVHNQGDVLTGNFIEDRGDNVLYYECFTEFPGHDGIEVQSTYAAFIRCYFDGSWLDYSTTPSDNGNRAASVNGDKSHFPWGPSIIDECVFSGPTNDEEAGKDSLSKINMWRAVTRRSIFHTGSADAWQLGRVNSATTNDIGQSTDDCHVYHNTIYECESVIQRSSDGTGGTSNDGHFADWRFKNNVCAYLGDGHANGNGQHITAIRNNSSKRIGDADDWRGALFDNNIFHTAASGDTFEVDLTGDGGGNAISLATVESTWPAVFTNNSNTVPTFINAPVGETLRPSSTSDIFSTIDSIRDNFAIRDTSPIGKGDAAALTQANGAGSSSTTLVVDDALYFVAMTDPNNYDLGYFPEARDDYIKIGTNDPVQITAIDYDTNTITLKTAQTWSNNDDIFLVEVDGVTVVNDIGGGTQ